MNQEHPRPAGSRTIHEGRVFRLRVDTLDDDGRMRQLDVVDHPGSYAIAAMPDPGHLVLVRQYRHPAGRFLWEIPAGTAEKEENPVDGALRELREETGYTAKRVNLLTAAYPTPGYSTELVRIYLARELEAGPQALEEDERIDVRAVALEEAHAMQASGEIVDMKTLLALCWLAGRQDKHL